jgi:hypothetical protein
VPNTLILFPVFALVALTIVVWWRMYRVRFAEIRAKRIPPQALATRAGTAARLSDSAPADNFSNLFETPVLFYVLAVLVYVSDSVTPALLALAWLYVAGRCVHSIIHITYNRVIHRFIAYAVSSLVLWIMWTLYAVHVLTG